MWQATLILHPQKICTALRDFDSNYNAIMVIFYQL